MKQTILFLIVIAVLSACSGKDNNRENNGSGSKAKGKIVHLTGKTDVPELVNATLLIREIKGGKLIANDSVFFVAGRFSSDVRVDSTCIRMVNSTTNLFHPFEIVLEPGQNVEIEMSKDGPVIGGTELNDKLQRFQKDAFKRSEKITELHEQFTKDSQEKKLTPKKEKEEMEKIQKLLNENLDKSMDFAKKNIENPVGKYYFYKIYSFASKERKEEMMKFATDDIKATLNR
jgi:hypothetical protein